MSFAFVQVHNMPEEGNLRFHVSPNLGICVIQRYKKGKWLFERWPRAEEVETQEIIPVVPPRMIEPLISGLERPPELPFGPVSIKPLEYHRYYMELGPDPLDIDVSMITGPLLIDSSPLPERRDYSKYFQIQLVVPDSEYGNKGPISFDSDGTGWQFNERTGKPEIVSRYSRCPCCGR